MKNSLCPGVLAVALLGLGALHGQAPSYPPAGSSQPAVNGGVLPAPASQDSASPYPDGPGGEAGFGGSGTGGGGSPGMSPPGLNDYLAYRRPWACCGPVGGHGPINCEFYLRPGVSFPIGGSILGEVLEPGFMFQVGARALFFTPRQDLAWTIDLGISSAWYDAGVDQTVDLVDVKFQRQNPQTGQNVIETIPRIPLTTSSVNETYVHLSTGHEVYLLGLADCADFDCKWRVGYDIGGRWGSAKLVFKERFFVAPDPLSFFDPTTPVRRAIPFKHRTDVVGGVFFSLHTDVEIPTKCCLFFIGLRTEAAYIWADLLQEQNNTDLMTINVLANVGVRF